MARRSMRVETIEVVEKSTGVTHIINASNFSAARHDLPGEKPKRKVTKKKASKKKASKKKR